MIWSQKNKELLLKAVFIRQHLSIFLTLSYYCRGLVFFPERKRVWEPVRQKEQTDEFGKHISNL